MGFSKLAATEKGKTHKKVDRSMWAAYSGSSWNNVMLQLDSNPVFLTVEMFDCFNKLKKMLTFSYFSMYTGINQ